MIQVFPGLILATLAGVTLASCKDDEQLAEPGETKKQVPAVTEAGPEPAHERSAEPTKKQPVDGKTQAAPPKMAAPGPGSVPGPAEKMAPPPGLPPSAPRPVAVKPPVPAPAPAAHTPKSLLPDLRLLLTATDVTQTAGPKAVFRRKAMPGMVVTAEQDALYYEPEKGSSYGFGIQVFHERNGAKAKQRFESMFASYPNAVEIPPVSGNSFFAYWDEVLFVAFMPQYKDTIAVVSCGRPYCDSDDLYGLAQKVGSRLK